MQVKLPGRELERLKNRVEEDYLAAISDHRTRMTRFRGAYRRWRNRVDAPEPGDEAKSNFSVPMVQWNVFQKWSSAVISIFGEDSEIVALPVGPSDQRETHKISRYISWRILDDMKSVVPLTTFLFRSILFGRSIAYLNWEVDKFWHPFKGEQIKREGPALEALWPDDIIVPAENVMSIQDFSFVIRRKRMTPQALLEGERAGRYCHIEDDFEQILKFASISDERDSDQEIQLERDDAEGVTYDGASSADRKTLEVHEWYGRWRMPKGKGREDKDYGGQEEVEQRELDETELLVRYIPEMHKIVGVQSLAHIYPDMADRRPFVEASLIKDGSYWSMGFAELLESMEDEETANHNLFTDACQFMVGPVGFYVPSAGFNPKTHKYRPFSMYPVTNTNAVSFQSPRADLAWSVTKSQTIQAFAERVTGNTDLNAGRSSGRPTEPKTATGQVALIEQGNVRGNLDLQMMRADLAQFINRVWELDCQFAPPSVFFRVTEEQSRGLFRVSKGGASMTAEEFAGRFDFSMKFSTSAWTKEADAQKALNLYQLDLTNPLVVNNPRALWMATAKVHKALGDANFADMVPEPPEPDVPKRPEQEWNQMLQGEQIHVHPQDNDQLHLEHDQKVLEEARVDPKADREAVNMLLMHMQEHVEAKRRKELEQMLVQQIVQQAGTGIEQLQAGMGGQMAMQGQNGTLSPEIQLPAVPNAG